MYINGLTKPLFLDRLRDSKQLTSTRENSDVFNSLDEIYLVFTSKKGNILYTSTKLGAIYRRHRELTPQFRVFGSVG